MRAMSIAATGMQAQQTNVEVIANNIANASTTAFARRKAEFQDLLYQSASRAGTSTSEQGTVLPVGSQVGLGTRNAAVNRVTLQGSLSETGNKLDMAVEGRGYFGVAMPDGSVSYTRDGSFKLSPQGQIVTSDGYPVEPTINVPANARDVTINPTGEVIVTEANGRQQTAGRLNLYLFANEAGLEATGGNRFLENPASGEPTRGLPGDPGFGQVRQGYLEQSNVNVVQEITQLIQAQRAYEMNSKVIEAADQMMQTANNVR
ncbi:flagellar basal-body rod protein FlgG [Paracraurococcus lichenis]|uniref:Flagellar basal-body rod protein FlgG n=1 Tax=Paracraurococcus lichenis TaxID=3064888 RepID=A0ABT9EA29_9PROT|nr:flagellar basal-body rod protein FlgG [Paracraurococcus sp. LOR1-02]MDO9713028.1 flagellar basal-body rod protein FlgG [Paracraurococcus sp. LOR1-02]